MLRKLIYLIIVLVLLAPAWSCGGDSPGDVAMQSLEAYNQREFDLLYDLSSTSLKGQLGTREEGIEIMSATWPPGASISDIEIIEENEDGDRATVVWKGNVSLPDLPVRENESEIKLVREDDQWKIDSN